MPRKPYLAFLLGCIVSAILAVCLLGLGVLASTTTDTQSPSDFDLFAQMASIPGGDPDKPPINIPPEPVVMPGKHNDLIVGTCWFGQPKGGGNKCRSTFTVCPKNDPTIHCTGWLWITCNNRYEFIGPHITAIGGADLAVIVGIPFAKYAFIPGVSVYFSDNGTRNGAAASLYLGHVNRMGACLLFNTAGTPVESLDQIRKDLVK